MTLRPATGWKHLGNLKKNPDVQTPCYANHIRMGDGGAGASIPRGLEFTCFGKVSSIFMVPESVQVSISTSPQDEINP